MGEANPGRGADAFLGASLRRAKRVAYTLLCGGDVASYLRLRSAAVRWSARLGLYERRHLRFLRTIVRRGDTVVDAGANFGAYTLALARAVGPSGRVLAFEPLPPIHAHLRANTASLPQVDCRNVALSDVAQASVDMWIPRIPGGIAEPSLASMEAPASGTAERTTVRVMRLDDLLPELADVTFLKLDVEGHELRCLDGARETLRRFRPLVQFEANRMDEQLPRWLALAGELGCKVRKLGAGNVLEPVSATNLEGEYNFYLVP